ncbi:MAG: Ig-like domain-containing protein [bacterium]
MLSRKVALVAFVLVCACEETEFTPPTTNTNSNTSNQNNNPVPPGKSYGDACADTSECRSGLVCADDVCGASGDVAAGMPCELTAQCAADLYCDALSASCVPAGTNVESAECGQTSECAAGLVCQPKGFSGACVATGTLDVGAPCTASTDCLAGLNCGVSPLDPMGDPMCLAGPAGLPMPWSGAECAEDEGNFRVLFEVPRTEPLADFFRHPYPSDARLSNGHPVLTGFPTPGPALLGYDVVQRYVDAIEATQDNFSPNGAIYFRFSKAANFDTLNANGMTRPVNLVDIDPQSPNYGRPQPFGWFVSSGRNRYICQNYMVVRPANGRPLAANTTYAVMITTDVKDPGGTPLQRDADFDAMLSDTAPASELQAAYQAYAPLRAYLADTTVDRPDVAKLAFATVFTTGNPISPMQALYDEARTAGATASELTVCDANTTSPCDDGLTGDEHVRGCFGESDTFSEIQGKLSLPIFQSGEAPYLDAGGAATPGVKRSEEVCMALTVPKATPPADGWPVLIVAHGTGGNYRGQVDDFGDLLTTIDIDGTPVQFVTLGWDQVQHGTRRGASTQHPNSLVYNYANPDAAQGNFLQGAAEIGAIVSWVASNPLTAEASPTGEAIALNANQIWFLGHSQGGTTGPLALPFDERVRGAVLSGAGAGLVNALVGKTSPVNSPAALQIVLQDPNVGANHPVVQLLQGYFDPVDPLNFARRMTSAPIEGVTTTKHIFQTHGVTDTYTPPASLNTLALALFATYATPLIANIEGISTAAAPIAGNVVIIQVPFTVAGKQYQPNGYDGHFVLFRDDTARQDAAIFLGTGVVTGVPELR